MKLGKRIDEGPYCLPDPEILRKKPEDKIPDAARHDLIGASSIDPGRLITPSSSPSADRRELTVFKDKRVMLSTDLELGSHLLGTIEDLIHTGGGSVTGSVHKADMFICHYRQSQDYQIASRAGCDVGNLAWLYHLITHNAWTSPLKRLLHYPIARNGLPGFKDFRISLSNYNGEARVYLENLAKAAGGEFTKTMKEDNTHLITAHTVSEKCEAAKEWNINMVNHLWLEESYAKWQIQSLANPRYTHFPSRTNLGEVVGQTLIDKQAIERVFFPKRTNGDHEMEDVSLPKPISTKDQNATSSRVPNSSAVHASSSANRDAVPYRTLQSDGPTPKAPKDRRRHSEGTELRTPAGPRYTDGKENDTPSTTGSRGAKDRAVAKLLDLAPDIALYEKESKRVGGVVFGGRKPSEEKGNGGGRKRSKSKDEDTGTEADEELRGAKKARKGREPASMRLLLTGDKRWVGQPKKESDERVSEYFGNDPNMTNSRQTQLRDLGILISQDPATCTHVASPQIVRTQKFACAMARAPIVLSADFVDQCLAQNKVLRADDYILNDVDGEKRLGFKLADATTRAKENKGRLLRGYNIYCTEVIRGGFDSYKSIIEANGAKCMLYRGRAGSIAASRAGGGDDDYDDVEEEYMYLISGVSPEEKKLWPKFRTMVQGVGKVPRIVRSDWMLDLALRQEVRWLDVYGLLNEDVET